eukprot:2407774-Rhodomonas_salina.1
MPHTRNTRWRDGSQNWSGAAVSEARAQAQPICPNTPLSPTRNNALARRCLCLMRTPANETRRQQIKCKPRPWQIKLGHFSLHLQITLPGQIMMPADQVVL